MIPTDPVNMSDPVSVDPDIVGGNIVAQVSVEPVNATHDKSERAHDPYVAHDISRDHVKPGDSLGFSMILYSRLPERSIPLPSRGGVSVVHDHDMSDTGTRAPLSYSISYPSIT